MTTAADPIGEAATLAAEAGISRIHLVAWRDLDDPTSGGSEIHVNELARCWVRAGLEVTLRTGRVPDGPAELVRDGVRVVRRGGPLGVWPRNVLASVLHRDGDCDARVEVWHGVSFLSPLWSRKPTIGIFHHVHTDQFAMVLPPGLAHLAAFLERRVSPRLYRGHPLITLSESVRRQMIDELGWPEADLHVVEPGVADRFVPGQRSATPLVVTAGRLMPQKRVGDVVDVLVRARASVPDLRAVIVGDGPERPALEAKISAYGAGDWLDLAGHVTDARLLELYQSAWVLLSASRKEGWGMTATEAAACATPAVVTDIPGHREAVVDGTTGRRGATIDELARHLSTLLLDHELRRRMGDAARARAETFRWEQQALKVMQILASEASRRR